MTGVPNLSRERGREIRQLAGVEDREEQTCRDGAKRNPPSLNRTGLPSARRMTLPIENTPRSELLQAWGGFLTDLGDSIKGGWNWWATLTFRDPPLDVPGWTKIGWKYSETARDRFTRELGLSKGLHDVSWVFGREYQPWRGVPHFHGLIAGVSDLRRDQAWSWWFNRYGFAKIEPYDRSLGAGYYLCKYVVKELGDIRFSPDFKRT